MSWDKEAHRIYSRTHARVLRQGCSYEIARIRAKSEVKRLMGERPAKPRPPPPKTKIKYHTEEERQAARKRSRDAAYARENAGPAPTHRAAGLPQPEKIIVPPELWADAERIRHLEHPSITGRLMGDPLPGRSALDQRKA